MYIFLSLVIGFIVVVGCVALSDDKRIDFGLAVVGIGLIALSGVVIFGVYVNDLNKSYLLLMMLTLLVSMIGLFIYGVRNSSIDLSNENRVRYHAEVWASFSCVSGVSTVMGAMIHVEKMAILKEYFGINAEDYLYGITGFLGVVTFMAAIMASVRKILLAKMKL